MVESGFELQWTWLSIFFWSSQPTIVDWNICIPLRKNNNVKVWIPNIYKCNIIWKYLCKWPNQDETMELERQNSKQGTCLAWGWLRFHPWYFIWSSEHCLCSLSTEPGLSSEDSQVRSKRQNNKQKMRPMRRTSIHMTYLYKKAYFYIDMHSVKGSEGIWLPYVMRLNWKHIFFILFYLNIMVTRLSIIVFCFYT